MGLTMVKEDFQKFNLPTLFYMLVVAPLMSFDVYSVFVRAILPPNPESRTKPPKPDKSSWLLVMAIVMLAAFDVGIRWPDVIGVVLALFFWIVQLCICVWSFIAKMECINFPRKPTTNKKQD